jgi:hypothetical protein
MDKISCEKFDAMLVLSNVRVVKGTQKELETKAILGAVLPQEIPCFSSSNFPREME